MIAGTGAAMAVTAIETIAAVKLCSLGEYSTA